jgi:hypothetical protein
MLTHYTRCPFADRIGGFPSTNPINGTLVGFPSTPPGVNYRPYAHDVMNLICSYEVLSPEIDIGFLVNARPTSVTDCGNTEFLYGSLLESSEELYQYLGRIHTNETLTNAARFFTGRWDSFGSWRNPAIRGEHPVIHNNLFGTVESYDEGPLLRRPIDDYVDPPSPLQEFVISEVDPFSFVPQTAAPETPTGNLGSNVQMLMDAVNSGVYNITDGAYTYRLSDFTHTFDKYGPGSLAYYYTVQYDNAGANKRYINQFAIRLTVDMSIDSAGYRESGIYSFSELVNYLFTFEWVYVHAYWHTPISNSTPPYNHNIDTFLAAYSGHFPDLQSDWTTVPYGYPYSVEDSGTVSIATDYERKDIATMIGYDRTAGRFTSLGANTFPRFERQSDWLVKESLPLTFFSFKEAMEKHFNFMSSNHIEALSEFSDVLRPLNLVKLTRVLPSYISKRGVLVIKVLDLITDAYLTYRLGIAPTISDAEDVARKAKKFRHRLLSGSVYSSSSTFYGKYEVEIDEDDIPGYPSCTIVVSSKVRAKPVTDSLMTAMITADSVGLLPKASTVWDLIPFSFVLDWFIPVGESADIVESQFKMLALDLVYCVHSIKIEHLFTDYDQETYRFKVIDLSEADLGVAGYRKFVRFVDYSAPVLGPSRIPFLPEPGVPDWFTAGSLLYKQL